MEHGPHEAALIKAALQAGRPIPPKIANAPELEPGLAFYMQAFHTLDSERSLGEVLEQIPWSKIQMYADRYHLDDEETEELEFFIRAIDLHHIDRIRNRRKPKDNPKPKR